MPKVQGFWEEELKYPVFSRSTAHKRRDRILGQSSETLNYNSGLYILSINKAYNRRDLYVSDFMGLYSGGLITGILQYIMKCFTKLFD